MLLPQVAKMKPMAHSIGAASLDRSLTELPW
jgi:hypothetical protein